MCFCKAEQQIANFNGKIIPTFQLFRCNAVSFDDNLIFSQLSHNNLIADSRQAINSTLYAFQTCFRFRNLLN